MAASTGPDVNTYQIPDVELGDTFNVWRDTTNTQTYKLNKMKVYEGVSSSSITVTTAASGTLQSEIADNVNKGVTFIQPVVFQSGVTFNGDVTFNASTFTVNANVVTIDDYAIVLGDTAAGSTDAKINAAGGGGLLINRGTSGNTAEWLWKTTQVYGVTGVWQANAHIGISGATFGIVPHSQGVLPVHGSGIRLDGGSTSDHGLLVELTSSGEAGTTSNRSIQFERYSPAGATVFMEVLNGTTYGNRPFVNISDGANRKVVNHGSAHSFGVGTVLRFNGTNYERAMGNSSENAEVIGVVSRVINSTTYELTFIGEIFGDFSGETEGGAALQAGRTYYLSPYTSGKLTSVQPTASGSVHKAVLIATSSTSAVVLPFTGGVLASPLNLANASSVATRIFQVNRFSKGDVVRFKAYPSGVTLTYSVGVGQTLQANYSNGIYVKAQANSAEDAEIAGMVIDLIGATGSGTQAYESFDILMDGFFDIAGLSPSLSGNIGSVHFLNTNCAGTSGAFESGTVSYTTTSPVADGTVRKPLFMATGAGSGYLFSYRGDVRGAAVGVTAADLAEFLVQDIRSGVTGDLSIGVYDTTTNGKESITISTGYQYDPNTVGATGGYVGIGGQWSPWNTGTSTQNRILLPLDVNGAMRLGKTLAATPQGQDLIVVRNTGDVAAGVTAISRTVIGTEYSTANLVIGTGVRPNPSAAGYLSTLAGSYDRSALVLGVSGTSPVLRWSVADNSSVGVGSSVSLSEVFSISGTDSKFRGTLTISDTGRIASSSMGYAYNRVFVGGTGPLLALWNDGSAITLDTSSRYPYSRLGLGARFSTSSLLFAGGFIDGGIENTSDASGYLAFFTTPADGSSTVERMRIDSTGQVSIGTTVSTAKLNVGPVSQNDPAILIHSGYGGDDQTAGGCMGLRIRAGDGSGSAVLMDVQDSTGATTHFEVRKDGLSINGATLSPAGTAPLFPARAFCYMVGNAAGTAPTILNKGNISTVTRVSTGRYRVTFSTPMPNANYCVFGEADNAAEGTGIVLAVQGSKTTTQFDFHVSTYSTAPAFPIIDMKQNYNYSVIVVG